MNNGWIKLHRKIKDSLIFGNEKGLKIWIWCLISANHKQNTFLLGRQKITINKGQFIMGLNKASEVLKLAKSTIKYWLALLEKEGQVALKKTNKYTIITIQNWDDHQEVALKRHSDGTQKETNNNDKNEKNEKKYNIGLPKRQPSERSKTSFSQEDYKQIIAEYENLKSIKHQGSEYQPLQQTIKTMFINGRAKDDIIACMHFINNRPEECWQQWNLRTIANQIAKFCSGSF